LFVRDGRELVKYDLASKEEAVLVAAVSLGHADWAVETTPVEPPLTAPQINSIWASSSVWLGRSIEFRVGASGNPLPGYRWQMNGQDLADSDHLSGVSQSTLTIHAARWDDAGIYTVIVSNTMGSVTGQVTTLAVSELILPQIVQSPFSQRVDQGAPVVLEVSVTGTAPMTFQWLKDGVALPGQTNASMRIASAQSGDSGLYQVQVGNAGGTVFSSAASLEVREPSVILAEAPQITLPPQSQKVKAGTTVTMTVKAKGEDPLRYQWHFNGAPLPNQTRTSLKLVKVTLAQAGAYTVEVKNDAGSLISPQAVLTIVSAPVITGQPQSQLVQAGQVAEFTVAAIAEPPPAYQWKRNGKALVDDGRITGAQSAQLRIQNAGPADAGSYTVTASNSEGKVTSKAVKLTLGQPPTIKTQPKSIGVVAGKTVTFKVTAAGTSPLTYQWQFNGVDLVNSKTVAGATKSLLTLKGVNLASKGAYTVLVRNPLGQVVSSQAMLEVGLPLVITKQPQSQTVPPGAGVWLEVEVTGTDPFQFQWLKNGKPIPDETGTTLYLGNVQEGVATKYSVTIKNAVGSVTSQAATITVDAPDLAPDNLIGQQWRMIDSRNQWLTTLVFSSATAGAYLDDEQAGKFTYTYRKTGDRTATLKATVPQYKHDRGMGNTLTMNLVFETQDEGMASMTDTLNGGQYVSASITVMERESRFAPSSLDGTSLDLQDVVKQNGDSGDYFRTGLVFDSQTVVIDNDDGDHYADIKYQYKKVNENSGTITLTLGTMRATLELVFVTEYSGGFIRTDPDGSRWYGIFDWR
jgi:hypothetical protein